MYRNTLPEGFVTVPVTELLIEKLVVVSVAEFIASLKVASTVAFSKTPVAPFAGVMLERVGATLSSTNVVDVLLQAEVP